MANLGIFEIDTKNKYVDLSTLTQITFITDTKYNMQVLNQTGQVTVCVSDTTPSDGGFLINNGEKFSYTAENNVNLYIRTNGTVLLNISK